MGTVKRAPQGARNRHGPYRGAWGRVGRPEVYTTRSLVEAVVAAGGRLERAAEALGCDSDTLRRRAQKSSELQRAIALMRSRSAKATFERRQREGRQRDREELARRQEREALRAEQAEQEARGAPRVEVVYQEGVGLVQREAPSEPESDVSPQEAPPVEGTPGPTPAGKRHPDLEWTDPRWPVVRILAPVVDKHRGQLLPGDVVRQAPLLARSWLGAGVAELVEPQEDVQERPLGGRGPAAPPAGGRVLATFR